MPGALLSNLLTFATALGVALLLVPFLRLVSTPFWRESLARAPRRAATTIGTLSLFVAVALLVPMGGDGLAVGWSDGRLALGLVLAAGLTVAAMTEDYRRLERRPRLLLQGCFALTATLLGLQPAGVTPTILACLVGAMLLVGTSNALSHVDDVDGLATGTAAVIAAFLALAASRLGLPAWCDLNLGLCGALLALLVFDLFGGRFKASLGESGCLCAGFLIGLTLLRLSAAAEPGTRPALGLVLLVPGLQAIFAAAQRARPRGLRAREHVYDFLFDAGLTRPQTLVLLWTATAVSCTAALRLLHLAGRP